MIFKQQKCKIISVSPMTISDSAMGEKRGTVNDKIHHKIVLTIDKHKWGKLQMHVNNIIFSMFTILMQKMF